MATTRLATGDDGRPVLVQQGPELARVAEVLAAARHPGVVEVVSWSPEDARLVLRWAGSRTLADVRPPPAVAARIAAALASTVADLHTLGIRHGRITPSRVVLDGAGRPVLCGFGGAALAGEDGPATADDVAGVGEVLRSIVGPDGEPEPIPERRLAPRARRSAPLRRSLLTLADHATHDDPARRPSARSLAASLASLVPVADAGARGPYRWAALLAGRDGRRPGSRHGRHVLEGADAPVDPPARGRRQPILAGALAVGLAAFGLTWLARTRSSPAVAPVAPPATTATSASPSAVSCPSVDQDGPLGDHDGDGCPSAIGVGDGVVDVDGARYAVGDPGDVLAVGDWDCDGVATVAAVRPATGEVFVFDGWGDLTVGAVASVPGAVALEPGACALVVLDAAGARTVVAT